MKTMKDEAACAVVRDLLPSYLEGLTSEETNAFVDGHLASCADCRERLAQMRGTPELPPPEENKIIDLLKKERRGRKRIVLGIAAFAAVLIGLASLFVFVLGVPDEEGTYTCRTYVFGSTLDYNVSLDQNGKILSGIEVSCADGVVTLLPHVRLAPSSRESGLGGIYTAAEPIRKVLLGDRVLWEDGTNISALADALYKTRHPYMGDMSANTKTALALELDARFGGWTNALDSGERPYAWTLSFGEVDGESEKTDEQMRACAYALLGVIGNLDMVRMEYAAAGERRAVTVTADDASAFFGQDVKGCCESLPLLNALLKASNLSY